jgi:hypothetical protein
VCATKKAIKQKEKQRAQAMFASPLKEDKESPVAWWWNGQTTNFYHTTSITTLHVHMASGCSGTLLQQTSSLPSN